nr:unnamed protein product [Callosobruchus analis]
MNLDVFKFLYLFVTPDVRPDLGDTYAKAHKCFLSLESKLLKNPALDEQYADVMNSYIKNDYMSLVPQPQTDSRAINYLPHHCVVRPSSRLVLKVLLEDIFVDDICSGADSIESALALQKDLIALLKSGCFELKKWASNDARLLTNLSQDECQIPKSLDKENSIALKVLGLQWDPKSDTMFFSYNISDK